MNKKLANAKDYEREYRLLKEQIENHKSQIIQQANTQASSIIKSANKEIEKTIRVIKESAADNSNCFFNLFVCRLYNRARKKQIR